MGWFGGKGILHLCGSKQAGQPLGMKASWETGLEREVGGARARGRGTKNKGYVLRRQGKISLTGQR